MSYSYRRRYRIQANQDLVTAGAIILGVGAFVMLFILTTGWKPKAS